MNKEVNVTLKYVIYYFILLTLYYYLLKVKCIFLALQTELQK